MLWYGAMSAKKIPVVIVLFCVLALALATAAAAAEEEGFVRVSVRFAKARSLPDAAAAVVREIGYGTLLRVLERKGDYLRVAPLEGAAADAAWYVLRGEVSEAPAAAAQAVVETRSLAFSPEAPAVGQPILFTARRFRTPNLLKWDMGDGTALTSGGRADPGDDATLSYAYAAPGRYVVSVLDEGGQSSLPPVTAVVTVTAHPRSLRLRPEKPLANHPVEITALNFREPGNLLWDLGDGAGAEEKGGFVMRHVYGQPGDYRVRAYDGGDKSQPPLTLEVRVAADPRRIRVRPGAAGAGVELEFSASGFNTPESLRWDLGDGTVIPAAGETAPAGPQVRHRYARPGTYRVRVYDWNGDADGRPVELDVSVAGEKPDRPVAAGEAGRVPERAAAPVAAPAGLAVRSEPPAKKRGRFKFGPFAGYFQPQDDWFKRIYGEGDVIYGGRLGFRIWSGLHLWLSLSRFQSIAGTTFTADRTVLTLLPASAFLRYNIGSGFFSPYAGVGYTLTSVSEDSEAVGNFKSSGGNVAAEAGLELRLNRHLYIDLGARFAQIKIQPEAIPAEVDIGGLQAGISLLICL